MVFKILKKSRLTLFLFFCIFLSGMASPPLRVGGPAPGFELETLKGTVFKSSDLKNKAVVLNFWATWCVPCTKEMPELNKAYASLKENDVEIVAINFAETRSKVDEYVNELHLKFPVLLDQYGDVSQDYRIRNLPVTYFISREGIITDLIFGGITQELIEAKVKKLDQATQPQEQIGNQIKEPMTKFVTANH